MKTFGDIFAPKPGTIISAVHGHGYNSERHFFMTKDDGTFEKLETDGKGFKSTNEIVTDAHLTKYHNHQVHRAVR